VWSVNRHFLNYHVDISSNGTIIARVMKITVLLLTLLGFASVNTILAAPTAREEAQFAQARQNARVANEAFERCHRYVVGWLAHADPASGLIPRNLGESRDFWNGRDSAADNYPFMVLTAAMTDRPLMNGRLLDIMRTEQRLTSRVGRLPDDYSFSKQGWRREKFDLDATILNGEVFHRRDADDSGGIDGVLAVRDGGDVEDGIRLGQGVIAGVVAGRAFVAQRLGWVNVAFDDEVGVGQCGFPVPANSAKQNRVRSKTPKRDVDLPWSRRKTCGNEPGAKASLPERTGVKKAISRQWPNRQRKPNRN